MTTEYFGKSSKDKYGFRPRCLECRHKTYSDSQPLTPRRKRSIEIKKLAKQGLKRCTNCNEVKPMTTEYFYPYQPTDYPPKDGLQFHCIVCQSETYQENRKRNLEHSRCWAKKHPLKVKNIKRRSKNKRNKILRGLPDNFTPVKERRMLDYWDNSCAICGRKPDLFTTLEADHFYSVNDKLGRCTGTIATNMIPLCRNKQIIDGQPVSCNQSKGNKDPYEWLTQRFGKQEVDIIYKGIMTYFEWVQEQDSPD